MAKQTTEQLNAFQALCRENGLDARADVWQHKQSGQWIIARTGIEKIQGHNNIGIELELCAAAVDFAVVKAIATRTAKAEGTKTAKKLSIQSLGSANAKNSQVTYYAEMAEKRAKSRAILMLMGFYALGVYGEDEADDFTRTAESASLPADVQHDIARADFEANGKGAAAPEVPKKPAPVASAPASAPLAASTTAAPSSGLNVELEATLQAIIRELASHHITPIERNKRMMGLNKLTLDDAKKSLANLLDTIEHRPSPEALTAARNKLRSFINTNAAALGEAECRRLSMRASALTVVAVDLHQEIQEADQRLKAPQKQAA